jgi:hypothetical protein
LGGVSLRTQGRPCGRPAAALRPGSNPTSPGRRTHPPGKPARELLAFVASANRQNVLACLQVGPRINTRLRDPAALTDCRGAPIWVGRRSGQFVSRLHDVHRVLPRKPIQPSMLSIRCRSSFGALPTRLVVTEDGPHPSPELGTVAGRLLAALSSPAIPLTCHSQRS